MVFHSGSSDRHEKAPNRSLISPLNLARPPSSIKSTKIIRMSQPATTTPATSQAVPVPAPRRPVLPSRGVATVKSVLSGDTVVLTGRPMAPGQKAPVVIFTFERVTAPRCVDFGNLYVTLCLLAGLFELIRMMEDL